MKKINVKWRIYKPQGNILLANIVSKTFSSEGYFFYENVIFKLASLDKAATLLFHFICEKMDNSNNIVHTAALRNQFIQFAKQNCSLSYTDQTVKKAFAKLVKVGLIINYDVRCDFTVNPRHVFKGSNEKRKELMQQLINTLINKKGGTKSNFKFALGI
jgi:hypothetical protein